MERLGATLVARSLLYSINPGGSTEFFGSTGILRFDVGEKSKSIPIVVANDNWPEVSHGHWYTGSCLPYHH